jgi:hypothetical protein
MGAPLPLKLAPPDATLMAQLAQIDQRRRVLTSTLPTNRAYFDAMSKDAVGSIEEQA